MHASGGGGKEGGVVRVVPGSTRRLAQLTGRADVEGRPHPGDTGPLGIDGTDLGISVEHAGRCYLFFGDNHSATHGWLGSADPVAFTTDLAVAEDGLRLRFLERRPLRRLLRRTFRPLEVRGLGALGTFEVPTGAFAFDGVLYVFVTKNATRGGERVVMARSFLAAARGPAEGFDLVHAVDSVDAPAGPRMINVAAAVVDAAAWPGLPSSRGAGLLLWGSGRYRASEVHLAFAELVPGSPPPPPRAWRFFTGEGPRWSQPGDAGAAVPLFEPPPSAPSSAVGELSVAWIAGLDRWLCAWNRPRLDETPAPYDVVVARTAPSPWGPWSDVETLFDSERDGAFGRYVHRPGQDRLDALGGPNGGAQGNPYGPYVVGRFTRYRPEERTATVVYTLSTATPYQVQLMATELRAEG